MSLWIPERAPEQEILDAIAGATTEEITAITGWADLFFGVTLYPAAKGGGVVVINLGKNLVW